MGKVKPIPNSWNLDDSIRSFLDVSLIGASIVSPEGQIVYANNSLAELFELIHSDEMVGNTAIDFYVDPTDRFPIIDELLKNKFVKDKKVKLKKKDGSHFYASLSFFLSEYAGVDHYFCLFYDLSDSLKREEMARVEAENQAKISYLENLIMLRSHTADKINNPLTIIQGLFHIINVELEKDEIDREKIQSYSQKINDAVSRIAEYVKELNEPM